MPRRTTAARDDPRRRRTVASALPRTTFSDVVAKRRAPRIDHTSTPPRQGRTAREAIAGRRRGRGDGRPAAATSDDPARSSARWPRSSPSRLERSGYQNGCAIATWSSNSPPPTRHSGRLRPRVARWRAALVTRFEQLGITPDRAAALADLTIPRRGRGSPPARPPAARTLHHHRRAHQRHRPRRRSRPPLPQPGPPGSHGRTSRVRR